MPVRPLLEVISGEKNQDHCQTSGSEVQTSGQSTVWLLFPSWERDNSERVHEGVNNTHSTKILTMWLLIHFLFTFIMKGFVLPVCLLKAWFTLAQVSFHLTTQSKMTSHSWYPCLHLLGVGITSSPDYHCFQHYNIFRRQYFLWLPSLSKKSKGWVCLLHFVFVQGLREGREDGREGSRDERERSLRRKMRGEAKRKD